MEQHPVPQNIIDVEFKLFGSFTLKQFSKIILGCLAGVVIYFLPIIPNLIKIPLIIFVVGSGILMALIQNFGVWLNGFLKSLFISPRYVWVKHDSTPELLRTKQEKKVVKAQKVSSHTNRSKVDITEVSLDKLFGSKVNREDSKELENEFDKDPVRSTNLDRMYSQAFNSGTTPHNIAPTRTQVQQQPVVTDLMQTQSTPINNYQKEISQLKYELSRLNKDAQFKQREQQIIMRINDLYNKLKVLQAETPAPAYPQNTPIQSTVTASNNVVVTPVERTSKTVFGLVVDNADNPISQAGVVFDNISDKSTSRAVSSADGKFATQELPSGKYNIHIEHPGYQFHTYQIDISDLKLPAFKFRAK